MNLYYQYSFTTDAHHISYGSVITVSFETGAVAGPALFYFKRKKNNGTDDKAGKKQ